MAEDIRTMTNPKGIEEFDRTYAVPDCVVLDSAYCSMGRMVALRACEAAGWTMHDSNTLLALVPESGVTMDDVEAFEDRAVASADLLALRDDEECQRITDAFRLAAVRALEAGPCLIHDRVTKDFVEGLGKSCASAFTYACDAPAKRVRAHYSPLYAHLATDDELDGAIVHEDDRRRAWHALGSDTTRWADSATYDLMINTDVIGRDLAAELLARLMRG